jgi:photosystem II stability/assembly factor-like uncharacterized protein
MKTGLTLLFVVLLFVGIVPFGHGGQEPTVFLWEKLPTEPYRGKQDDIYFVTPEIGWYVNGAGRIYKTTDGGTTWKKQSDKPGTYFRCIGFIDEKHGFAGNIGLDYFPGVTDTTALYETTDGGETWNPVQTPPITGLCAIDILREPFINAGNLDEKVTLFAGGRVGGPGELLRSDDRGKTWQKVMLPAECGMILDVRFLNRQTGIVCAATDPDVRKSRALILKTTDGGKTWKSVYQSQRPFELTWKCAFPTEKTGYVTIQSYNPDKTVSKRYIAKTTDGGDTWTEILLTDDFTCREFGVAFLNENTGWVGGMQTSYQTTDGGKTWTPVKMGTAVNKIRILKTPTEVIGYAIGIDVYKMKFSQ